MRRTLLDRVKRTHERREVLGSHDVLARAQAAAGIVTIAGSHCAFASVNEVGSGLEFSERFTNGLAVWRAQPSIVVLRGREAMDRLGRWLERVDCVFDREGAAGSLGQCRGSFFDRPMIKFWLSDFFDLVVEEVRLVDCGIEFDDQPRVGLEFLGPEFRICAMGRLRTGDDAGDQMGAPEL